MSDPIAELLEALRTNGKPSLPWVTRWSQGGVEPVRAAWEASSNPHAMCMLLDMIPGRVDPYVIAKALAAVRADITLYGSTEHLRFSLVAHRRLTTHMQRVPRWGDVPDVFDPRRPPPLSLRIDTTPERTCGIDTEIDELVRQNITSHETLKRVSRSDADALEAALAPLRANALRAAADMRIPTIEELLAQHAIPRANER